MALQVGLTVLVLLAATVSIARAQCPDPAFATGSALFDSSIATSIAKGDFNGDGVSDLAITGLGEGNVSGVTILLADGQGGLGAPAFTPLGSSLIFVQTSDLNGDGKLDLVLSDYVAAVVWVSLGNGDGTFLPAAFYPTAFGNAVGSLIADLNGDGVPDVALADSGNSTVDVLLGNGDGTLQAAVPYAADLDTWALSAGDLDGDGKPDLVAVNTQADDVTVFLNDGQGHFANSYSFLVTAGPLDIKIADFNEDGHQDLVIAGGSSGTIQIWLGDGAGNFSPGDTITPETFSGSGVTVGKINGDSHLDLGVGDAYGRILILNGDGSAHFTPGQTILTEPYVSSPIFADLDGDGLDDMVFGTAAGGSLSAVAVILRDPISGFGSGAPFFSLVGQTFPGHDTLSLADFDGDGHPDVVGATYSGLSTSLGDGNGGFGPATILPGGQFYSVATADFDGDGNQDVAATSVGSVSILLGDGSGGFGSPSGTSTSCCSVSLAVADFNGDGHADVVTVDPIQNLAYVALGDGAGNLGTAISISVGSGPYVVRGLDVNEDGQADLEVMDQATDKIAILLGNGDGTFGAAHLFSVHDTGSGNVISMEVSDVNGDGKPDVVIGFARASNERSLVTILFNSGGGQFVAGPDLLMSQNGDPSSVGAADVNADGVADVLATDLNTGVVWVFLGTGGGDFAPGVRLLAGEEPSVLVLGDVNGDGKPDIVANNQGALMPGVSVLLNSCVVPTVTSIAPSSGPSAGGTSVTVKGTLFEENAVVSFGGSQATDVVFVSSTTLTAVTPPHAPGLVAVTVVNPGSGSGTLASAYTYSPSPAPSIAGISPSSGLANGGLVVTVTGAAFQEGASLEIGGMVVPGASVQSASSIEGTTPALAAGTLNDVTVRNPDTQEATLPRGWFADFLDVPQGDSFHAFVEKVFRNGVTAGCGGGNYCRPNPVTRAQMAVFLLKGEHGPTYVPPGCTGIFPDVECTPAPAFAVNWIEQLFNEGITGGCGSGNYCPDNAVTRAQMAVFLLKAEHGSSYVPPVCAGIFPDVECTPTPAFAVDWIEQLYDENVTGGCGGGNYCPGASVTRGQMAVFLTKTFNLQ